MNISTKKVTFFAEFIISKRTLSNTLAVLYFLTCVLTLRHIERAYGWSHFDKPDSAYGTLIVDFKQLAKYFHGWRILTKKSYVYFVIPPRKLLSTEERLRFEQLEQAQKKLRPLIDVLRKHTDVYAVTGYSHIVPNPVCTLHVEHRTIRQYENFSRLWNDAYTLEVSNGQMCMGCDLLSDTFLVRGDALADYFDKNRFAYRFMGEGMHLSLFLHLKQHTLYCPHINMTEIGFSAHRDYTCNSLRSRWDQKFPGFFEQHGIYRIISLNERQMWLTCVWSAQSIDLKLPIVCQNFLYQYLLDITNTLQQKFNLSYRLNFGTVLGAVRSHDIIPWTPDIDISLNVSRNNELNFRALWRQNLDLFSDWLFSSITSYNTDHLSASKRLLRAYPRCPVFVSAPHNVNLSLIDQELFREKVVRANIWIDNSAGNVDLYFQKFEFCDTQISFDETADVVNIRGRNFSAASRSKDMLACLYGEDYMNNMPNSAKNFADSVSSNV